MSRCTSALVTESTRKGMSSVTTWMTLRALDQPSDSVVGLKTRTAAVPGVRVSARSRWDFTAPARVRAGRALRLLVGHVPEVVADDGRPVRSRVEAGESRDDGVQCGRSGVDR